MYYKGEPLGRVANKLKRELLRMPRVRVLRGYAHLEGLAHGFVTSRMSDRQAAVIAPREA